MSKQLLVDYLDFSVSKSQINESLSRNDGKLIVNGILQRANSKNQNGRIYPKKILMRESKRYFTEFIQQHRALGELDHPDSSVVNLQNASHNILEIHWNGDDLFGTIEILKTPSGNILTELFKAGIKVGISSRALGSTERVEESDADVVQNDLELISWDFVSNPSTHGAFVHPINESKEISTRVCGNWCKVENIIGQILRGE